MSLSQWTRDAVISGNGIAGLSATSDRIEGGSSLRIRPDPDNSAIYGLTTGAGVTTGKIRTLVRVVSTGGSGNKRFGLFGFMGTGITLTTQAYWLIFDSTATGGGSWTPTYYLGKGDFSFGTFTTIATGTAAAITYGSIYSFELKWQLDSTGSTLLLTASRGTATDFSDLTAFDSGIDNSPRTQHDSAGVGAKALNVASTTIDCYFDRTQLFKV